MEARAAAAPGAGAPEFRRRSAASTPRCGSTSSGPGTGGRTRCSCRLARRGSWPDRRRTSRVAAASPGKLSSPALVLEAQPWLPERRDVNQKASPLPCCVSNGVARGNVSMIVRVAPVRDAGLRCRCRDARASRPSRVSPPTWCRQVVRDSLSHTSLLRLPRATRRLGEGHERRVGSPARVVAVYALSPR